MENVIVTILAELGPLVCLLTGQQWQKMENETYLSS